MSGVKTFFITSSKKLFISVVGPGAAYNGLKEEKITSPTEIKSEVILFRMQLVYKVNSKAPKEKTMGKINGVVPSAPPH